MFIHLRCHSAYSLCQGAIKVKAFPKLCDQHNMPAVGVTDIDNLFGAMEFSLACADKGIQPIIGCTVHVRHNDNNYPLALLCMSDRGYRNLSHLLTLAYTYEKAAYKTITLDDLWRYQEGLICLSGYEKGLIGSALLKGKKEDAVNLAQLFVKHFGDRFYLEICRHGTKDQNTLENDYLQLAVELNIPLVATNEVYFSTPDMFEAHDALRCIAEARYVVETDREHLNDQYYFKSSEEMKALFDDLPEAIEQTIVIAKRCQFFLKLCKPQLPPFASEMSEADLLRKKAKEGLQQRLTDENIGPEQHDIYFDRLTYELEVIESMGFPGYFLIVADFIQWAKSQDIPVGPGRGSGAGSVVAWSLTITDINPMRYGLLFERFLNPERVSMPDFDIDFCQDRRDEVIAYVRQKYGDKRVAHIITFGTLQTKGVLRDVGRVLSMPYGFVDKIVRDIPFQIGSVKEAFETIPELEALYEEDESVQKLATIAGQLEGLYRHASTHAAGVVISGCDLEDIVPLYREEDSSIFSTQFSMKYVELAGLLKFDFLGLKNLTVIQDAVKLINAPTRHPRESEDPSPNSTMDPRFREDDNTVQTFNLSHIPMDDPKAFKMLGQMKTVGIFQFESAGMRDIMGKLKPDHFEDLIAINALYRPGPMDDIPKYIARKLGQEPIEYLHPKLKPILETTYGVMVYQEQVMRIAQDLAGYTLGAADLLRRAMGKKIKSEMDQQRALFVEGCHSREGGNPVGPHDSLGSPFQGNDTAITKNTANQIFDAMAKFAGYGFNKSHAAPYALIAYQTAYLKANYPKEFFASLLTHDSHNQDKLGVYYEEMKSMGVPLYPPCINNSKVQFTVEGEGVRFGLGGIKNVGTGVAEEIVAKQPFTSIVDFFTRVDHQAFNKRQGEFLVQAGVFDVFESNRNTVFSALESLLKLAQPKETRRTLFDRKANNIQLEDVQPWDTLDQLNREKDSIGFYLSQHPLDPYKPFIKKHQLDGSSNGTFRFSGMIHQKNERISKNGNKFAYVTLTTLDEAVEMLMFADQLEQFRSLCVVDEIVHIECYEKAGLQGDKKMIVRSMMRLDEKLQAFPVRVEIDFDKDQEIIMSLKSLPQTGKQTIQIYGNYQGQKVHLEIKNVDLDLSTRQRLCQI